MPIKLFLPSPTSNGDQYDGDWVSGKRHGHGMLRAADGTIYDVSVYMYMYLYLHCPATSDSLSEIGGKGQLNRVF